MKSMFSFWFDGEGSCEHGNECSDSIKGG